MRRALHAFRVALFAFGGFGVAVPSIAQAPITGFALGGSHVIFIIDTSGSMRRYEWDRVEDLVVRTLDAHPALEEFQVLNDEGNHLLEGTRGDWIADSPATREAMLERLADWDSFSNSNPLEGLQAAIETYYDPGKDISVFVLGDDLAAGSGQSLLGRVEAMLADMREAAPESGSSLKLHALAFPIYYDATGALGSSAEFVTTMRQLTAVGGGSFVALPSRRVFESDGAQSREDLTGLPSPGDRALILVDASSAMSVDDVWSRIGVSVERLLAGLDTGARYQVIAFDESGLSSVSPDGQWLAWSNDSVGRATAMLQGMMPAGETSLDAVATAIDGMSPQPEGVYLFAARRPTAIDADTLEPISDGERNQRFAQVVQDLPEGVPVNVLLFDAGTDPQAAPAYWTMALNTGGSLVAPSADWP